MMGERRAMNGVTLYEQLRMIEKFRDKLYDEESVKIYDARIEYLIDRNKGKLFDTLYELNKEKIKKSKYFEEFMQSRDKEKIIIFGAGKKGKETKEILEKMGFFPKYFCDNNHELWGKCVEGIEVLNPEDLPYFYRNYSVILGSVLYARQFNEQLVRSFFPQGNVFFPRGGILVAACGNQYFDFEEFKQTEKEIFIDAGAYNGETTKDFVKWANKGYDKVYLFEPDKRNMRVCKDKLKELKDNVVYINKGTWSEQTELHFKSDGAASKIVHSGESAVVVTDIDSVLNGKEATFIKMDVEGAELQTLMGAEKTIKDYLPKLAVCLYHKPEDILEIPAYIMSIAPDYKYALRHYSTDASETILYAWK